MPIVLTSLWLGVQLGCSPSTPFEGPAGKPTETFTDPGLRTTGASPTFQLWTIRGRYELPKTTLPEGYSPVSTFPLELSEARGSTGTHRHWQAPSPIDVKRFSPLGAPRGFEVFANDKPVRYAPNLAGQSYAVRKGRLLLSWPQDQPKPKVTVSYESVRERLLARDFGSDPGQDPFAFVRTDVTLFRQTRQGLVLPAPGIAEWDIVVPAGGRFEGWTAIAPLELANLRSDGAYVALSVIENGSSKPLDRRFVTPGAPFERWQVDLSTYAGRKVRLRLESEGYGTRDFDHVFVGSPTVWGDNVAPVRRVILIGLDTTRPDHFGFYGYDKPTTPKLDKVLAGSSVFVNAWTPAPRTRPSFRSSTTGRDPLNAVGATNIAEVFSAQGFATAGIVANIHLQPRFGFHKGFDEWQFDPEAQVDVQVDRALEFLARYPDRDLFLFLHIMDPHLMYRAPSRYERQFVTDPDPTLPNSFNRWTVNQWLKRGDLSEQRKAHIIGLYDAEMRFTDDHLGRLFDQIDRLGEPTLTVMHNDHGEEFFEHGGFEHNHTLYDDVTRGLLMFRSNAGQANTMRIETPATLMDIGPTLYAFLGLEEAKWPAVDGRNLKSLLLPPAEPKPWPERPIGIAHLRYGLEQWGVVHKGHKYIFETASGREELYDLATDPGEQVDLARKTGLEPWRKAASEAHNAKLARGWRINVALTASKDRSPFVLKLPKPALAALIVNPEAEIRNPANQVWGQSPRRTKADVGTVALSDDKKTLTFTPSSKAIVRGQIAVVFDLEIRPSEVILEREGQPLTVIMSRDRAIWRTKQDSMVVEASTVIAPPPSEIDRIRALEGEAQEMGENREMLKELGYVE
ncbi:MAG: sulfatase [Myxococcota bacterium]